MLAIAKREMIQCDVIKIPNDTSKLEEYLKNYNLKAKDEEVFNYIPTNSSEYEMLKNYHDDKYERAAILTAEELYVGYTFDHLEEIRKILSRK